MEDWDATTHIPAHLKAEILPDETPATRHRFWVDYSSASKTMASRLRGFSEDRKSTYQRLTYLLCLYLFLVQGLTRDREVAERQQQTRKAETAAVVAAVRAEANFSDT